MSGTGVAFAMVLRSRAPRPVRRQLMSTTGRAAGLAFSFVISRPSTSSSRLRFSARVCVYTERKYFKNCDKLIVDFSKSFFINTFCQHFLLQAGAFNLPRLKVVRALLRNCCYQSLCTQHLHIKNGRRKNKKGEILLSQYGDGG